MPVLWLSKCPRCDCPFGPLPVYETMILNEESHRISSTAQAQISCRGNWRLQNPFYSWWELLLGHMYLVTLKKKLTSTKLTCDVSRCKSFKCFEKIYETSKGSKSIDPPPSFMSRFGFSSQVFSKRKDSCHVACLIHFHFFQISLSQQSLTPKWHWAAHLLLIVPFLWPSTHIGTDKFTVSHWRY